MKLRLAGWLLMAALLAPQVWAEPEEEGKSAAQAEVSKGKSKASKKVPRRLPGGWVLHWNDEFDGNALDETKWKCELGVVRNEGTFHAYTESCVEVKDGMLHLLSKAEETPNATYSPSGDKWFTRIQKQPYASGSVTTRGKQSFAGPGRLEFRARIPKAKGVWPALWTMHQNTYPWPANGEIDILEHISQEPNTVYSVFRWGADNGQKTPDGRPKYREVKVTRTSKIEDYSKDFHTYVLEWDDKHMRILIDDDEIGKIDIKQANYPNGDNPLKTPCYIIMNTAIGGWAQKPQASEYPVSFDIDYVRFYTKRGAKQPEPGADPTQKTSARDAKKPAHKAAEKRKKK